MKLSIIIPCYNDQLGLNITLSTLHRSKNIESLSSEIEVIIVDSSHTPINIESSFELLHINYIHSERKMYAGQARNLGVRHAQSDWIGFLDCGLIVDEHWLLMMIEAQSLSYEIIWGRSDYQPATLFERSYVRSFHRKNYSQRYIRSSMMTKEVFNRLGQFTEKVHAGEDLDFYDKIKNSSINEYYIQAQASYVQFPKNSLAMFRKWVNFTKDNVLINQASNKIKFVIIQFTFLSLVLFISRWSWGWALLALLIGALIRIGFQFYSSDLTINQKEEILLTIWCIMVFDLSRIMGLIYGMMFNIRRIL
jgi:glycosyltransferase involved in cell wall biosynthesis